MGMHLGMDERHTFAVDIRTNDPLQPVKTVRWHFTNKNVSVTAWMQQGIATASPTPAK